MIKLKREYDTKHEPLNNVNLIMYTKYNNFKAFYDRKFKSRMSFTGMYESGFRLPSNDTSIELVNHHLVEYWRYG